MNNRYKAISNTPPSFRSKIFRRRLYYKYENTMYVWSFRAGIILLCLYPFFSTVLKDQVSSAIKVVTFLIIFYNAFILFFLYFVFYKPEKVTLPKNNLEILNPSLSFSQIFFSFLYYFSWGTTILSHQIILFISLVLNRMLIKVVMSEVRKIAYKRTNEVKSEKVSNE